MLRRSSPNSSGRPTEATRSCSLWPSPYGHPNTAMRASTSARSPQWLPPSRRSPRPTRPLSQSPRRRCPGHPPTPGSTRCDRAAPSVKSMQSTMSPCSMNDLSCSAGCWCTRSANGSTNAPSPRRYVDERHPRWRPERRSPYSTACCQPSTTVSRTASMLQQLSRPLGGSRLSPAGQVPARRTQWPVSSRPSSPERLSFASAWRRPPAKRRAGCPTPWSWSPSVVARAAIWMPAWPSGWPGSRRPPSTGCSDGVPTAAPGSATTPTTRCQPTSSSSTRRPCSPFR